MKIGIVCYPSVGGSGVMATELGHQLALRGHEVHFITYEVPFRLKPQPGIFFHEVEISDYDLFKYPDYALTLAVKITQVAKEQELDIIHAHYAIPHATSGYLAKQMLGDAHPCIITTLHGTDITLVGQHPSFHQIVRFSIEQSCGVTAVSNFLKEETLTSFTPDKAIEVIPNFFVPDPDLPTPPKSQTKTLIHSSNFRPVKRIHDIIELFAKVRRQLEAELILVGDGPDLPATRRHVEELALGDSVTFVGRQHSVDRYIAAADLFLLPSEHESFGLAALEAMAYGVPVIGARAGGLPEVVEDGQSGYLLEVGDVAAMAARAMELLTNNELYKKMSESARDRAQQLFSAEAVVPRYEQFYENIRSRSLRETPVSD